MTLFTILGYAFLYGVPVAIFLAIVGIRKGEGLWGNLVSTVNVAFASLVAVNYWEPLAKFMSSQWAGALYVSDYIAVWGIFTVTLLILEEVSMRISRVKVKFPEQVELFGGPAAGVVLFTVFVLGFYQFTLMLAPIPAGDNDSPIVVADMLGKSYSFLSTGNLAPFIESKPFDFQKVVDDQAKRRIALKVQGEEKTTLLYDGTVPGGQ
ncbi:MAG: hypothetical protein ACRC46_11830 [Thermoguttaceae bacterium]